MCGQPGAQYRGDLQESADHYCDRHYEQVKAMRQRMINDFTSGEMSKDFHLGYCRSHAPPIPPTEFDLVGQEECVICKLEQIQAS